MRLNYHMRSLNLKKHPSKNPAPLLQATVLSFGFPSPCLASDNALIHFSNLPFPRSIISKDAIKFSTFHMNLQGNLLYPNLGALIVLSERKSICEKRIV